MPDAALEDTEEQFVDLLERTSEDLLVSLRFISLPGVRRGERAKRHVDRYYFDVEQLWDWQLDGLIVTGTEPREAELTEEPYWESLVGVLEWAEANTSSTVLSCLAAHAAVLYSDGIVRNRLTKKRFGVFGFETTAAHPFFEGLAPMRFLPHSRWNDLNAEVLRSNGYEILAKSSAAGVDLFVKKKMKSLFVYFQSHPEYSDVTLFKEYRRDVRRFLRGELAEYPGVPSGYFDAATIDHLNAFRQEALKSRVDQLMTCFPEGDVTRRLQHTWRASANCVYRRWLKYLKSMKTSARGFVATAAINAVRR